MVAVLGLGLCPGSRAHGSTAFEIETVDPRIAVGKASTALDHLGRPRIAYRYGGGETGSNGDLYYASRESGSWILEPVDTLGDVGWDPSLILDAADIPHIAYTDPTHNQIKYATLSSGSWVIETVDAPPSGYFVQQGSLAFDSNGDAHVAYGVNNVPLFRYASRNAGTWTVETIAFSQVALWISLRIDSQDVPHVSSWDAGNHVKYATKVGGTWILETIDTMDGYSPGYSSLSLDSDVPWVAFFRPSSPTDGDLALATRGGAGWTVELIDTAGTTGHTPSLRFEGSEPRVSYYDISKGSLRYARRISGLWSTRTVDSMGNSGSSSSLEIDPEGHAWIAYLASDENGRNTHLMAAHEAVVTAVPMSGPQSWSLNGVWPNPAGSLVRVSFSLPSAEPAKLALFDLSGRVVASRALDAPPVGSHMVSLSGVGAGAYWIQLTQAGRSIARKVVVIR